MKGASDDETVDEDKVFLKRKQIALKNDDKNLKMKPNMRYTEHHIGIIRT